MKILITGAKGFVGKNLSEALKNIMDGKDKTHPEIFVDELYLYDIDSPDALLDQACANCDFVFNLAGVNRPQNNEEFMLGNCGFSSKLLDKLNRHKNKCSVMLASSLQASLIGRYDGEYGRSKKAGENIFFAYERETGSRVLVYRFPNLFGKWCRPNYNSAVATFCYNMANDLEIMVNDASVELELLYIDDLVEEMLCALLGKEHRCNVEGLENIPSEDGKYCFVPTTYKASLGEIVGLLETFKDQAKSLQMPSTPSNSFAKKLYSTYISYLPKEKAVVDFNMNIDQRGSFTELIKTTSNGQISVNVSKPGITKGQHWHNTKWEIFFVLSGHARIEQRKIGTDEVLVFDVSGEKIQGVYMLPGYTHNIINLSDTEDLVTLMWANENFDPEKPDTFFEVVK